MSKNNLIKKPWRAVMTRSLAFLLITFSAFANDSFDMYFFKFYISDLTNIEDAKTAEKKLCAIIDKNCELEVSETINEYSVLPLYSEPDEKSKVIGAFVNARSREKYCAEMLKGDKYLYGKKHHDTEHCFESAFASFIVNKSGVRKNLTHYVSMASNVIDPIKFSSSNLSRIDKVGSSMRTFFRYLRVMDAKNKKIISHYEPREDNWYAFANPDESGTKLWFKFKSDLRSSKYAFLHKATGNGAQDSKLTKAFFNNYISSDMKNFYKKHTHVTKSDYRFIGFVFCSFGTDKSKLISLKYQESSDNKEGKHNKKIKETCSDESYYNVEIPTFSFYKNGFFANSISLIDLEDNDWIKFQRYRKEKAEYHKVQKVVVK